MDTRKIVQKSVNILVEYYENNIQPFKDAMDDDILWIGPLQGQMIRGKKNLSDTYALEEHDLTFDVFDMQASVVYSTKQHCEVLLTFIVDTHYPDQSVIRCHQRVLLSWQHYIEHTESGKRISHDLIHSCFVSNAIPADTRDTIYPVHFTELPFSQEFSVAPSGRHITLLGKHKQQLYLLDKQIIRVQSHKRGSKIFTLDGVFESTESPSRIFSEYPDVFVRVHSMHLVNPIYVQSVRRFALLLQDGKNIPPLNVRLQNGSAFPNYLKQKAGKHNASRFFIPVFSILLFCLSILCFTRISKTNLFTDFIHGMHQTHNFLMWHCLTG